MLNSSSDSSLQELSHRLTLTKELRPALHEFIGKKQMIIEELDVIIDALLKPDDGTLTKEDLRSMRVTRDNIFPSNHAWAFKKGAPFLYHINKYLLWFCENGLQKKWSEKLMNPPPNVTLRFDGSTSQTFDDDDFSSKRDKLFGQFVLWIIGIGLSCFCFIGEIVVHNFNQRNRRVSKKGNVVCKVTL